MSGGNLTELMCHIIRCPNATCSWQWRHYAHQGELALLRLAFHVQACNLSRPCPTCGATGGHACISRHGNATNRPHNARRSAAA